VLVFGSGMRYYPRVRVREGECAGTLYSCIFYFKYMIESILYFKYISSTVFVFCKYQILFKLCICILYFKYKLHVFDTTQLKGN